MHPLSGKRPRAKHYFTRAYFVLLAAEFCVKTCKYMQHSSITLYVLNNGGSATLVGVILAMTMLPSLFTKPIAGRLLDKNRTLPMFIGVLIYAGATYTFLAGIPIHWVVYVVMFQGIGNAFVTIGIYSLASDCVVPDQLTRCYTFLNLVETMAAAISTTLAISLRRSYGFDVLFRVISGIATVVVLCVVVLSVTAWKLKREGHGGHKGGFGKGRRRELKIKAEEMPTIGGPGPKTGVLGLLDKVICVDALIPALMYMVLMFAGEAVLGFLVAYGEEAQIGNAGVFYTVQAVAVYISSLCVGPVEDRFGFSAVLITGFAAYFLSLTGIFINLSYTSIVLCGIIFGIGVGFAQPALNALAVNTAGEKQKGRANSTISLLLDLGGAAAGLVFGRMVDGIGYRSIYLTGALAMAAMTVVYVRLRKKRA